MIIAEEVAQPSEYGHQSLGIVHAASQLCWLTTNKASTCTYHCVTIKNNAGRRPVLHLHTDMEFSDEVAYNCRHVIVGNRPANCSPSLQRLQ